MDKKTPLQHLPTGSPTHNGSSLNLAVISPHSLLFHNFFRKVKGNAIMEFLKRKFKFIFQNEHSVSSYNDHFHGMYLNSGPSGSGIGHHSFAIFCSLPITVSSTKTTAK